MFYLSKLLVKPLKAREGGQAASRVLARAPDDVCIWRVCVEGAGRWKKKRHINHNFQM